MSTAVETAIEIRSFRVDIPEDELEDLRRRIAATRWPERETVADESQGVQLATMQELVRYWGTEYDFRTVRGEAERVPTVHHRDRRPRHPLHPRSLAARERVAGHHHARLAGLDHRDAERRRPAHRSDGTRRRSGGRVRCGGSVDARLRVLREADGYRLGPCPHRGRLDHADEAPGIHAIRRARRRLGRADHGCDGRKGTSGVARHPLQHARHGPTRRCEGAVLERPRSRRPAAVRSVSR